ncbi:YihY/virulence factor BrkB family protein [Pseudogracilibacillus auburnensis]|uniref:Membrane protein n=1 Tax=Pseudogracilibacillus auburnensis TaxID=1494959 RepID=A0A2V3VLN7_9BACI|nr:YihY/virulence factor BrkB family protein [Pseudogracilibacillus auburnensis]MBO1001435.1 YihY/virulence factor BrkB family protein [Pseudogracilibacillus auburnensis]PXW82470.1 membrane protein [Pseudogracilibacillus auburnensis]
MSKTIQFGKELMKRIDEADVTGLSAQLAYFFLLSLFPFLLFLVTLVGFLPIDDRAIIEILGTYLPEEVIAMIDANLTHLITNRSGGLLSIGIIGTLWSASNGFNAITKSFNKAYRVDEKRSFFVNRLVAFGLMIGLVLVIAIALLLSVFGRIIGEKVFGLFGLYDLIQSWNFIRWTFSTITFFIVFFILYKLAPNEKIKIKHAMWGAMFTTALWQITSLVFAFYVNTLGNYSATYGSLGTVIVLMIWFYLSGIIITTGGVINAYMKDRSERIVE